MAHLNLYLANDTLLQVEQLRDKSAAGGYLNAATVTATVKDRTGATVSGASAIPLTLVAGSVTGDYEGVIDDSVVLVEDQQYLVVISAVQAGKRAKWTLSAIASVRP